MDVCVQTQNGAVRGILDGSVCRFHGIPYAAAPVGPRRFRLPEPPEPWGGVWDAAKRGVIAPQGPSDLDRPMGPVIQPTGEACLTLAVSTPSLEGRRPVAVWLHGGANCYGGGDLPWYDGADLARREDVVVVNLNFRLGVLGFLFVEGVQEENLSIEDQILALRWVRDNIASFGGDPDRVTLFGQSAGANAIAHLVSRPDTAGLFHQIVLQSPSLGRGNHRRADAFAVGRAVVDNLGLDPAAPDLLERLQACPVEALLQAADRVPAELVRRHQGMYFKPVMDDWHTPEQTARRAAEMAVRRKLRVLIGFTRDEVLAFDLRRDPASLEAMGRVQRQRYEIPGTQFAREAAGRGCPVWKYEFDWSAPDSDFGACHCLELPFLFGNLDDWDAPFLRGARRADMERLRDTLQRAWGQFFRGEDPGDWPRYTAETRQIRTFDNEENAAGPEPDYGG